MTENISRRSLLAASLAATAAQTVWAQAPALQASPTALKMMIIGRRKPGMTLAEHRQHIRQVHGALVLSYVKAEPASAPRRYVQNAVFNGSYRSTSPGTDPLALNRDFVTQVWFPDIATLQNSIKTPFYLENLKGDEGNFVDQSSVVIFPVREREVLARRPITAGAHKLFVLLQRAPGVEAAAFNAAWRQTPDSLKAFTAADKINRHVQNESALPPGAPAPLAGVDEFWLESEAAAQALLTEYLAWVRTALVVKGLVTEGGYSALLATELVLRAGAAS